MPTLQQTFQNDHPVALVTGSGSPRVGRAVAKHLASLGCHIALHANTSVSDAQDAAKTLQSQHGVQTVVTTGSLENSSVPAKLVQETVTALGANRHLGSTVLPSGIPTPLGGHHA